MTIVAGMLLLCAVKISDPGTHGSFILNVPTKVLYVDKGEALVEYDFNKAHGIDFIGDKPIKDLIGVADLLSPTYGRCKKK